MYELSLIVNAKCGRLDLAFEMLERQYGETDDPRVKSFPHVQEIIKAKDNGVFFPRTPIWTELADAMHRAVQKVMLNNADIKTALDEAAAEVDRATAEFKKS